MGQQQLLLIVLGVIIVGVAVVIGINLFESNARIALIDTVSSEIAAFSQMALTYYQKPKSLGGGGHEFNGFRLPYGALNRRLLNIITTCSTEAGYYTMFHAPFTKHMSITGVSYEYGGFSTSGGSTPKPGAFDVTAEITITRIQTTVRNEF